MRHEKAPKRKVVVKHQRRHPKRQHPKPATAAKAAVVVHPKQPGRSQALGPSLVQLAANETVSPPSALLFFLALMIGVSVLVAALAVAPQQAVPRPLLDAVGSQRELLLYVAIALAAAAGLVLLLYVIAAQ